MTLVQSELKKMYIRVDEPDYLCFTSNTAGSKVRLEKQGIPTSVNLETSTDGSTWADYTFGSDITLSSIGDKVYFRNKSETTTGFSTSTSDYYSFTLSGSISASGDVTSLLNKNGTTTLSSYCFYALFLSKSALKTTPKLPATTLASYCYYRMFEGCDSLTTIPSLPATDFSIHCCDQMFKGCSYIRLSETSTGAYTNEYRLPTTGTGTEGFSFTNMFQNTGGTWTGTPSINTTYYTSNTLV